MHGNILAVDAEQCELLETYLEVFGFILRMYAGGEVLAAAVGCVTYFRESSNMTEEVYSNQLWNKALRSITDYGDRRLRSLFV